LRLHWRNRLCHLIRALWLDAKRIQQARQRPALKLASGPPSAAAVDHIQKAKKSLLVHFALLMPQTISH
jgi:hypothetical protein